MKLSLFIGTYVLLHILSLYKCTVHSSDCPCKSTLSLEDVIANHVLRGHVISTTVVADVGQCFHQCVFTNLACKSFNVWKRGSSGFWCEMNDQNKDFNLHALEAILGRDYYEVNNRVLSKPHYFKDCNCKYYIEFTCECQEGYLGNQCDEKARSCKDYLRFKRNYKSGIYVVFEGNNETPFSVFCDMDLVNLSAWTLVLSYALQYNKEFNSTPFYVNDPLDEDNPNWSFYRLSLPRMHSIRSSSDYWRATCNFTTYGIDKRDYALARWTDIDLLSFDGNGCRRFAYIDVRGSNCSNCTTWVHQGFWSRMFLVAARYGQDQGCDLVAAPDSSLFEESFGYYKGKTSKFRCSADANSTTEFWFGGKI